MTYGPLIPRPARGCYLSFLPLSLLCNTELLRALLEEVASF